MGFFFSFLIIDNIKRHHMYTYQSWRFDSILTIFEKLINVKLFNDMVIIFDFHHSTFYLR